MPLIRYTKKLDGNLYIVEAVGENSWKRLWLVSAYIQKNSPANPSQGLTVTQTPHAENQPLGNVQNANASPANSMITQSQNAVNNRISEDSGNDEGNIQADRPTNNILQPSLNSSPVKSGDTIMQELADALEMAADTRTKKYLRQMRNNTRG